MTTNMTSIMEQVETSLDTIRPYLKQDGGDIQEVEIKKAIPEIKGIETVA